MPDTDIRRYDDMEELEHDIDSGRLTRFLHESLKPYEDSEEEIADGLSYALEEGAGQGGFALVAWRDGEPVGAVLMLRTGMSGYVPPWILLYIAVSPDARGRGIGGGLMDRALSEADGPVKLHVEHDNPARRLYERKGFGSKYLEMRYEP